MRKYKVGLLVGRFQPFHKGHLHLIEKSLNLVDMLVVGIGSVGVIDTDNFLTYDERKRILDAVIKNEGWSERIKKIVPLNDYHNDKLWLENSLKQSGEIDVVIGNNEWTNGIFERAGYPILRLGYYKRYLYEGERIRKLMREGKSWEERVPGYIVTLIKKAK